MKDSAKPRSFTYYFPFVGPLCWIASIQYFIIQLIVAQSWTTAYSLTQNTISDLGNTVCDEYSGRFVCSPGYNLMNVSLIALGLTMTLGAILINRQFRKSRASIIGFSCMAIAGFGTLMVGVFPENTIGFLHAFGAALPFAIGNLGLVILGYALDLPKPLRYYTLLSGYISLFALVLFMTHFYLGLGQGGIERIVAYPQTVWLIIFGIYTFSFRSK